MDTNLKTEQTIFRYSDAHYVWRRSRFMQFYVIEPEVAGGWGDSIVVYRSVDPVSVERIHYQFEGWLGDELLTTSSCLHLHRAGRSRLGGRRILGFSVS